LCGYGAGRATLAPTLVAVLEEEISDCDFGFGVQIYALFHQMLPLNLARVALDLDLEVWPQRRPEPSVQPIQVVSLVAQVV
jgi:hypothetical protein